MYWNSAASMATRLPLFMTNHIFCFSDFKTAVLFAKCLSISKHTLRCLCPVRFESAETAARSKTDEQLREDLLRKLIDRELLGGTAQISLESSIESLPLRELPPGSTSSLYLMYLAYMRMTGDPADAASRSTFYTVAKLWRPCLRFRRKTEHSLCFECSRLKSAIHGCRESWLPIFALLSCKTSKK